MQIHTWANRLVSQCAVVHFQTAGPGKGVNPRCVNVHVPVGSSRRGRGYGRRPSPPAQCPAAASPGASSRSLRDFYISIGHVISFHHPVIDFRIISSALHNTRCVPGSPRRMTQILLGRVRRSGFRNSLVASTVPPGGSPSGNGFMPPPGTGDGVPMRAPPAGPLLGGGGPGGRGGWPGGGGGWFGAGGKEGGGGGGGCCGGYTPP